MKKGVGKRAIFGLFIMILMVGGVSAWSVDITDPTESSIHSTIVNSIDWQYTGINKSEIYNVWYEINGVKSNFPGYTNPNTTMTIGGINSQQGDNIGIVYVNTTSAEVKNATVNFWVDSIDPQIFPLMPSVDPFYTNSLPITLSMELNETNPSPFLSNRYFLFKIFQSGFTISSQTLAFNFGTNISTEDYDASIFSSEEVYKYNISAQDTVGHITEIEGTIIFDTTSPIINLIGSDNISIEVFSIYTDAGVTATDNLDPTINSNVVIGGDFVNTSALGIYVITYNVQDQAGNSATQVTRTVNVVDTTIPVITLIGNSSLNIEFGTSYVDDGATALDNYDGNLTSSIIIVNPVDENVLGTYVVTYNVQDSYGNNAVEVTRTVNVVDTTAPVITLIGNLSLNIEVGTSYVDDGATALDNYDGNLTSSIIIVNPVDENVLGTYVVTYNVQDSYGNNAVEVTRTVNVVDTTIPFINLVGSDPQTIELGDSYSEQGATAMDNYDGDISGSIIIDSSTVDTNTLGSYIVTYDVSDSSGNVAVQVTRTVNVVDTTAPSLTSVDFSSSVFSPANADGFLDNVIITMNASELVMDWGTTYIRNVTNDTVARINGVSGINSYSRQIIWDGEYKFYGPGSGNFVPDGNYTINTTITDQVGNSATVELGTLTIDNTNPINTTEVLISISTSSATFNFDADESSNLTVNWNATSGETGSVSSSTFSTSHNLEVSGLSSGTEYLFSLTLCDEAGNCAPVSLSEDGSSSSSFTTSSPPASSSSGGGGGGGGGSSSGSSSSIYYKCEEWGEWSECSINEQSRICIKKVQTSSFQGIIESEFQETETQTCLIPLSNTNSEEDDQGNSNQEITDESKGFFARITGGAVDGIISKTGKTIMIVIIALGILLAGAELYRRYDLSKQGVSRKKK